LGVRCDTRYNTVKKGARGQCKAHGESLHCPWPDTLSLARTLSLIRFCTQRSCKASLGCLACLCVRPFIKGTAISLNRMGVRCPGSAHPPRELHASRFVTATIIVLYGNVSVVFSVRSSLLTHRVSCFCRRRAAYARLFHYRCFVFLSATLLYRIFSHVLFWARRSCTFVSCVLSFVVSTPFSKHTLMGKLMATVSGARSWAGAYYRKPI
jgi:hypothetical protein